MISSERTDVIGDRSPTTLYNLASIFDVTLPAVWLVLVEHIIKRGKLVVSGGVTRGRVARGVIGVTTPKDIRE